MSIIFNGEFVMKAAVFYGENDFRVTEIDKPTPKPYEVIIKVDSAMICATDVHIIKGEQPATPPVVLGHEFSGVIAEIGEGVNSLKPGDRVGIEPHKKGCGKCKFCRTGKRHLCLNKIAYGTVRNGGFAEYCAVPEYCCYKIPDGISLENAALCENIGCCMHGMDRIGMRYGQSVLVLGGGFVGMMLTQLSRMACCGKLIVSEPKEDRREMLLAGGADITVDPMNEDLLSIVMAETGGLGVDVVIEAAGLLTTARAAHTFAGRGATIMYFGLVPPGQFIEIEPNAIFRNEWTIMGSAINPDTYHRVLEILPRLKLDGCVTHRLPLDRITEGIETAAHGESIKVCIKP